MTLPDQSDSGSQFVVILAYGNDGYAPDACGPFADEAEALEWISAHHHDLAHAALVACRLDLEPPARRAWPEPSHRRIALERERLGSVRPSRYYE